MLTQSNVLRHHRAEDFGKIKPVLLTFNGTNRVGCKHQWPSTTHGHGKNMPRPCSRFVINKKCKLLPVLASQQPQELQGALKVTVRRAESSAELRAAACLRAYAFATYAPDSTVWPGRTRRRMKADEEWDGLQQRLAGKDSAFQDVKVECWIATIPADPSCPVAVEVSRDMELSSKLPADPAAGQPTPTIVVGTLDVNTGDKLPGEHLQGQLPPAAEAEGGAAQPSTARAYLSNVCVAKAARRRGVAATLIRAAEQASSQRGVSHMYVHVEHDNSAATTLYKEVLGFQAESEESVAFARTARRPRRLLLHKQLS